MIQWIKGANIEKSQNLYEGYTVEDNTIVSVLNADNIMKVMRSFVEFYKNDNCFFFLEVPCKADEEEELRNTPQDPMHKDVYYLDNIWADDVLGLFDLFEDILVNDGLIAFGIGNHESEIGKYKYNMVKVFSSDIDGIKNVFEDNNIYKNAELIIPWDIINENNPGRSERYDDINGRSIYDIIDALEEVGLYKAETREED